LGTFAREFWTGAQRRFSENSKNKLRVNWFTNLNPKARVSMATSVPQYFPEFVDWNFSAFPGKMHEQMSERPIG